ncbi:MAG TPA: serine/threonine-protein kinase [Solirubrobacteraceae bacterium]|nr:serine/threonine-protein kinase [Solirubrobacteraceae bacterium]
MGIAELGTGSIFAGYQIDGIAGEGGMGVVYRATEIALQRPVALKLIAADFAGDRKFRERFQRESMLAASIDHPNVIPVYEAGEVNGELYIAMRFVDGTDLLHAVTRGGALDPARAVRIVSQVAAALDAAHRRGLVHRDVKPGNVLLTGEGDEEHAYLTDFGLVKTLTGEAPGTTTAGHFVGTLDYSAPEAIQGQEADARSDVYALACVLFFALTRTSPFLRDSNVGTMFAHVNEPPPSLLEAAPGLPPALGELVERALSKNPDERPQTAGEFARAAQEALAGGGAPSRTATPKPTSTPTAEGPARRNRALGIILPAVLVLGLIAAGLAAAGVFKGEEKPPQASATAEPTATATATATAKASATPATITAPKVVASIPAGKGPDGISVTDDGTVFVTDASEGNFIRIDPETNETIDEPLAVGKAPDGVAGAKKVTWIASSGDDKVRRVESNPDPVVIGTIPVGKQPNGIALGKQLVWVTNTGDDSVDRIDRGSATVVGTPIGVGDQPYGVFIGTDSAWIANHGDDTVTRIDSSTAEVIGTPVSVGKGPRSLVEEAGSVWVANSDDGTVTRINAQTQEVDGDPIRVGQDPREITAGGGFVWVANAKDNTVSQIDPKRGRVVGRAIPVGDDPIGIAFGAGSVWTANHQDGTVTRISSGS